jgi:hypothetical protein
LQKVRSAQQQVVVAVLYEFLRLSDLGVVVAGDAGCRFHETCTDQRDHAATKQSWINLPNRHDSIGQSYGYRPVFLDKLPVVRSKGTEPVNECRHVRSVAQHLYFRRRISYDVV